MTATATNQRSKLKQKFIFKKKKAAKYYVNGVSGMLCGKTLFFPRFLKKSGRGMGQSPIKSLMQRLGAEPHKIS